MSADVAAVIVNYNSGEPLARCLASVAAGPEAAAEVIVVDNASADDSFQAVQRWAPLVSLRRNPQNVGFARAVNQGIADTCAPLVLVLNPDCRVAPGTIGRLAAELDAHPRCALVGPRVLDPDGRVQGSARGDPTLMTGVFGRSTWMTRLVPAVARLSGDLRTVAEDGSAAPSSVEVDWVSGACMLARREALESVGGFDERFFLFWEDADLCRRLRARGYSIRYVPHAVAVHAVGESRRSAPALSVREFHRSAYRYYTKHNAVWRYDPRRILACAILWLRCRYQLARLARVHRTT